MASIELSPISEHLTDNEIQELEASLADANSSPLDIDEHAQTVFLDNDLDDSLFAETLDHLEVHDVACTVYVPPDFEEVFFVGDHHVGSAHMLLLVLEELREEFFLDEDEDEEANHPDDDGYTGDDDDGYTRDDDEGSPLDSDPMSSFDLKEKQLRQIWELLHLGAKICIRDGVCMFLGE